MIKRVSMSRAFSSPLKTSNDINWEHLYQDVFIRNKQKKNDEDYIKFLENFELNQPTKSCKRKSSIFIELINKAPGTNYSRRKKTSEGKKSELETVISSKKEELAAIGLKIKRSKSFKKNYKLKEEKSNIITQPWINSKEKTISMTGAKPKFVLNLIYELFISDENIDYKRDNAKPYGRRKSCEGEISGGKINKKAHLLNSIILDQEILYQNQIRKEYQKLSKKPGFPDLSIPQKPKKFFFQRDSKVYSKTPQVRALSRFSSNDPVSTLEFFSVKYQNFKVPWYLNNYEKNRKAGELIPLISKIGTKTLSICNEQRKTIDPEILGNSVCMLRSQTLRLPPKIKKVERRKRKIETISSTGSIVQVIDTEKFKEIINETIEIGKRLSHSRYNLLDSISQRSINFSKESNSKVTSKEDKIKSKRKIRRKSKIANKVWKFYGLEKEKFDLVKKYSKSKESRDIEFSRRGSPPPGFRKKRYGSILAHMKKSPERKIKEMMNGNLSEHGVDKKDYELTLKTLKILGDYLKKKKYEKESKSRRRSSMKISEVKKQNSSSKFKKRSSDYFKVVNKIYKPKLRDHKRNSKISKSKEKKEIKNFEKPVAKEISLSKYFEKESEENKESNPPFTDSNRISKTIYRKPIERKRRSSVKLTNIERIVQLARDSESNNENRQLLKEKNYNQSGIKRFNTNLKKREINILDHDNSQFLPTPTADYNSIPIRSSKKKSATTIYTSRNFKISIEKWKNDRKLNKTEFSPNNLEKINTSNKKLHSKSQNLKKGISTYNKIKKKMEKSILKNMKEKFLDSKLKIGNMIGSKNNRSRSERQHIPYLVKMKPVLHRVNLKTKSSSRIKLTKLYNTNK